jgi:hypothetical protein
MIKRLKAHRSHGTLVANPRRKKRNGGKRRHKRGLHALSANPRHKRKHAKRNPAKLSHFLKRRKSVKRRNPMVGVGGVDLVSVGVGAVATIGLGAVGQAIFDKYLSNSITNQGLRDAAPSLIVAGAAFAAHKYMKNPKVKEIAKMTMILSVFKAVDAAVGQQIEDGVKKVLPSMSGAYVPALRGYTSGAYLDAATGGAYMGTHGVLPSATLYGL